MGLTEYKRKRDFRRTPEPAGAKARKKGGHSFVVQKHAASRLHYDFRLELDGVLKSWAVPKGPSYDPREKRLAVEVEDHPLEYGGFEGVIPQGQYGGGTVVLWDRGRWTPHGDAKEGLRKGKLSFDLEGEKLQGAWALVRLRGREEEDKPAWLLIKEADGTARKRGDITKERPESVTSGRGIAEVAAAEDRVWQSGRKTRGGTRTAGRKPSGKTARRTAREPAKPPKGASSRAASKRRAIGSAASRRRAAIDPSGVAGAKRGPLPATFQLQLATLVDAVPSGDEWLHEIKFDGYRIAARIDGGRASLVSRNGKDWTARFPAIASALTGLPLRRALVDGEVVVVDPKSGATSFQGLQQVFRSGDDTALAYFAFDLLHLDGWDLRGATLEDRKAVLQPLLAGVSDRLRYSDHVVGRGVDFHREACRLGLEGIIAKRRDRPHAPGRGRDWLKIKCQQRQEFVIGGFTEPSGSRKGLGALLVGVHEDGELHFAGKVGTGFTDESLRDLRQRLEALERKTPPFADPPKGSVVRGVHWVEPKLVGEVEFTEWTQDGSLRHPSFQGLREDKRPADVVRERPRPLPEAAEAAPRSKPAKSAGSKRASATVPKATGAKRESTTVTKATATKRASAAKVKKPAGSDSTEVAGVRISHPDRVLYPEMGLTKLDLGRYYEAVADWILPHLSDRPLTLVRCPEGRTGECFFQKHVTHGLSDHVHRVPIQEQGKQATYLAVDSLPGIVALVQVGALELHVWGSRLDQVERPDRIVFDLDPDPALPWSRVADGARHVRRVLEEIGLQSWLKTTGGKGLHVVVPIQRRDEWDEVKEFSRSVAQRLVREAPDRTTAVMAKAKRGGKIFVDYLRNGRGATWIAPYSTRAREGATVSTPLHWDELGKDDLRARFTAATVPPRLAKLRKDPWEGLAKCRQSITAAMRRAAGEG